MRFAAALLRAALWLVTTVALAIAIPAAWLQSNIVNEGGYAALAQKAAGDPALQSAAADELTNRAMALIAAHSGRGQPVDSAEVHDAAVAFTAGPAFRRCSPRPTGRHTAGCSPPTDRAGHGLSTWPRCSRTPRYSGY